MCELFLGRRFLPANPKHRTRILANNVKIRECEATQLQPETLNAKHAKSREREGKLKREPAFAKATADETRNPAPISNSRFAACSLWPVASSRSNIEPAFAKASADETRNLEPETTPVPTRNLQNPKLSPYISASNKRVWQTCPKCGCGMAYQA